MAACWQKDELLKAGQLRPWCWLFSEEPSQALPDYVRELGPQCIAY